MRVIWIAMLLQALLWSDDTLHDAYQKLLEKGQPQDFAALASEMERAMVQPASAAAHYNLGTVHLKAQDYGKSIYHLQRAHRLNPNDIRFVDHLQRAAAQAGVSLQPPKPENAVAMARQAWFLTPSMVHLGLALLISIVGMTWTLRSRKCTHLGVTVLLSGSLLLSGTLREAEIWVHEEVVLGEPLHPKTGLGQGYPNVLVDPLPAGSMGRVLRRDSGWMEVQWYAEAKGWVPEASTLSL